MVSVLTESFFINNPQDSDIGNDIIKQQVIGKAYANAILEYFGMLNKPIAKPENTESKVGFAQSFDKNMAGTYTTIMDLNMRLGANTSKELIITVPGDMQVRSFGYYTKEADGTVWMLVTYKNFTGFMLKAYLKK